MSDAPKAGDADTLATGGRTATFEVLVVVGMLLDGELFEADVEADAPDVEADVEAGVEATMAGTDTAVLDAAVVADDALVPVT